MKITTLLIAPNHSIITSDTNMHIESAEASMLEYMNEHIKQVGVSALIERNPNTSLPGKINPEINQVHCLSITAHTSTFSKIINYIYTALKLPFVVNRYRYIYIFFPGYCGLLTAIWSRLLGKKYGIYVRGTWLDNNEMMQILYKWIFSGAQFMVVTGEAFRRKLSDYCSNVVNEVPLTALHPKNISAPPNRDADAYKRLLFAGRLSAEKGVLDIIKALAILRDQNIDLELYIAGGGTPSEIQAINDLKQRLNLDKQVALFGHVSSDELANLYSKSAFFVFPSFYAEGFPRVLYEAMMFSSAIITCRMPGTEGFLIDDVNCIYCLPANPDNLALRLSKLIDKPSVIESLGNNARIDVEKLYDSFTESSHSEQVLKFISQ